MGLCWFDCTGVLFTLGVLFGACPGYEPHGLSDVCMSSCSAVPLFRCSAVPWFRCCDVVLFCIIRAAPLGIVGQHLGTDAEVVGTALLDVARIRRASGTMKERDVEMLIKLQRSIGNDGVRRHLRV